MLKNIKKKLKQEKEIDYRLFEAIFLVIAFLSVAIINNIKTPMTNPTFVPSAVTGLTTVSGILTAFIGFWLSNEGKPADAYTKRVMAWRTIAVISILLFSLLLVVSGLAYLVYGSVESAFKLSICGTLFIMLVALDVISFRLFNLSQYANE